MSTHPDRTPSPDCEYPAAAGSMVIQFYPLNGPPIGFVVLGEQDVTHPANQTWSATTEYLRFNKEQARAQLLTSAGPLESLMLVCSLANVSGGKLGDCPKDHPTWLEHAASSEFQEWSAQKPLQSEWYQGGRATPPEARQLFAVELHDEVQAWFEVTFTEDSSGTRTLRSLTWYLEQIPVTGSLPMFPPEPEVPDTVAFQLTRVDEDTSTENLSQ